MLQIEVNNLMIGRRLLTEAMEIYIPPGGIHLLQGPNGCGKSLLLDVVTGIHRVAGVSVSVNGRWLKKKGALARWRAGVRRMFQSPTLPPELSVSQILRQCGDGASGSWWREALRLLTENGVVPPAAFSSHSFGQQRLVELVVALSSGQCCLLDEPFSGLRPALLKVVSDLMRLTAESGRAILVIDHLFSRHAGLYDKDYAWNLPDTGRGAMVPEALDSVFDERHLTPASADRVGEHWSVERFSIGKREVMRDAEIDLPRGTLLLLVGGNGSGKSTLMRELGGYAQPWMGVSASVVGDVSPSDMLLSPQPPKLVNELTAEENLRLMVGGGPLGAERTRAAARRLLEWLGFPVAFLRERAEVLSGGEAGMVALVGAALSRARILLLDEPFESLSPQAFLRALELLRHVTAAGKSALVTTHNAHLISLFEPSQIIDLTRGGVLSGTFTGGHVCRLDSILGGVAK